MKIRLDNESFMILRRDHDWKKHLSLLTLHIEFPWSECVKEFDAARRIYLFGEWLGDWGITIAMNKNAKTQTWNPRKGWTGNWRWISVSPPRKKLCFYNDGQKGCGKWKNHSGPHASPLLKEFRTSKTKKHYGKV